MEFFYVEKIFKIIKTNHYFQLDFWSFVQILLLAI